MKLFYSEEQILNYANTDKYFIDYSPKDLEKNLHHLAQLHYFGNHLGKKLDGKLKYRKEHKELNHFKYKEFIGSIRLYSLIIKGQTIENHHYCGNENDFEKDYVLFKNELIDNLEKLYLPIYSLEKLIKSYLESDEIEYLKQSMFFKIDFEKIPKKIIDKKDLSENLPSYNSYNHLNSLLLNHIERYRELNLDWFTEMGMSQKQTEHCNTIYTEKMRNRVLDDDEIKNMLKSSILKLVQTIYF